MDSISFNSLLSLVKEVGFPILVCMYLLIRYEKRLEAMTLAISSLGGNINTVLSALGHVSRSDGGNERD